MEHRHLFSTSQVLENEQDQNWNQMHIEQPYVHMGMFSSADNGPLHYPVESMTFNEIHTSSDWNSSSRFHPYNSINQNIGASHCASDSAGSSQSPFLQTSSVESLCMVSNGHASHSASLGHDGQPVQYVGSNFVDLTAGSCGVPHKRKSPGIPTICERGSTSRHYSAGSSSNQPIPSDLHPEKPNMNYPCMPWYHVNSDPNYRGNDISIRGEGVIRNVRSRSVINSEPIPGSSHFLSNPSQSSLSLSHHLNYASSVDPSGSSSGSLTHVLDHSSMNSQGSMMLLESNNVNQFLTNGGATTSVEVGGYCQGFVTSINLTAPLNFNSSSIQSVTGACSSYSQGPSSNFRPSSSSLRLGHVAQPDEGLRLVMGSYPARDPRLLSSMGRPERNGRSRILRDRYRSDPNGVTFHNRLTHERHMILDRSSLHGSRHILDQHRDMRLDVDHMSYEELLALGERIGSVNTGLAENMISRCLTESIYCSSDQMQDEETCVICLEEYKYMDDVGTLKTCGHVYHVSCIKKWLSMKNLCPICKGSALRDDMKVQNNLSSPLVSITQPALSEEESSTIILEEEENSSESSPTILEDEFEKEEETKTSQNERPARSILISSDSCSDLSTSSRSSSKYSKKSRSSIGMRRLHKSASCKSLEELELEELKGFMDMGFIFAEEQLTPQMISVLPGLQRLKLHKNEKIKDSDGINAAKSDITYKENITRPYLSEAWLVQKFDLSNLRVPKLTATAEMKKHIRMWAKTVASAVRQES